MSPVSFMLEGPIGKEAYEGAEKIAKLINEYLDEGKKAKPVEGVL